MTTDINPARRIVTAIREAERTRGPLPNGGRVRDAGHSRTDALVASGAFTVEDPRNR